MTLIKEGALEVMEELLKKVGSIYKLSNMAALRAMELNSGVKPLVDSSPNDKVTSIAIREIYEGKIKVKKAK